MNKPDELIEQIAESLNWNGEAFSDWHRKTEEQKEYYRNRAREIYTKTASIYEQKIAEIFEEIEKHNLVMPDGDIQRIYIHLTDCRWYQDLKSTFLKEGLGGK